jgi:hypothetical protein
VVCAVHDLCPLGPRPPEGGGVCEGSCGGRGGEDKRLLFRPLLHGSIEVRNLSVDLGDTVTKPRPLGSDWSARSLPASADVSEPAMNTKKRKTTPFIIIQLAPSVKIIFAKTVHVRNNPPPKKQWL